MTEKVENCDGKAEIVTETLRHNLICDGQIVTEHGLSQFFVTDNCDGDFPFFCDRHCEGSDEIVKNIVTEYSVIILDGS